MDFGILPPEVNSGRMYSGPGPGPVLAAAAAWSGLAAELELTASSYQSVIAELITGWAGPSAMAMTAAATPYVAWLHGTAALAEQTAAQAYAAAAAFEAAFAMTVPPPVVATNRSLLLTLIATNFFGQNLPAIAATEAAYAEMWAQDATAMYGYAAGAASATRLTGFTPPPETTNPAGSADQAGAVGRAAGSAVATKAQQVLAKLPSTTHGLPPPAAETTVSPLSELPTSSVIELSLIPIHLGLDLFGAVVIDGLGAFAIDAPGAGGSMLLKEAIAAGGVPHVLAGASTPAATPVSANMGHAAPVSGLSVPKAWTAAAGETSPVATAPAAAGARAAPAVPTRVSHHHSPNQMAMAATAGLGVTAGLNNDRPGGQPTTGRRITSPQAPPNQQLQIAAELGELTELHDAGILSDQEFATERGRLFGQLESGPTHPTGQAAVRGPVPPAGS